MFRYNAEKKKIGMYYSTPVYQFRMKCHLCNNHFEIKTDPGVRLVFYKYINTTFEIFSYKFRIFLNYEIEFRLRNCKWCSQTRK